MRLQVYVMVTGYLRWRNQRGSCAISCSCPFFNCYWGRYDKLFSVFLIIL